jgi:hypothetical protein
MPKEIISDDRARQGPPGRPVLRVLVGALFLCAVAISGYLVWVGTRSPDDPSQNASRESTTGSASGSSNASPTNRTSPANPANPAPAAPSATGTTNR